MADQFIPVPNDSDPVETKEWIDALRSILKYEGSERAQFILDQLASYANQQGLAAAGGVNTPYMNTIPAESESELPDQDLLKTITNYARWNAVAMVMRGGRVAKELGGHIASFAGAAYLYEVGFQHFYHAPSKDHGGDLVYIQGHSSPGIYARAYMEGRLTEKHLDSFRQEVFNKNGISSYPHPWLMPDFWQFPTVSMGLGPLMGIYQARFLKYMHNRGLIDAANRKVWVYCGDGELGEPESLGALNIAGRQSLDNLIFVISCNLQRLDGPVWGNGQIIQEYEGVFRGAGWNVIKAIWGSNWQKLFDRDSKGILRQRISELVDGEYQDYSAKGGACLREHFFGKYPELLEMVADMTDDDLSALQDAGNDPVKVYNAYKAAVEHKGQPTVILIKTVKGYGMGSSGEAQNTTHQTKKLSEESLKQFRDRFALPLTDKDLENLKYKKLKKNSPEEKYLQEQRKKLGGYLPARQFTKQKLEVPSLDKFNSLLQDSGEREFSSTMAFVRILGTLLKDKNLKERIVPIVADESRTFGMEGLFRQIGIYAPLGQRYEPEDKHLMMYYREDTKGQLMQEGISEAGAFSSWIAAGTSYSSNNLPMIPFYIYYSMFGFQRFGDLVWAAGDMQAHGFIIGGTAGRTTLAGEGLQHQDGHNLLMFSFVPNCRSYDPTFAFEMAVIIQDGLKRMYHQHENVFYYITGMNENYHHPAMPKGAEKGIIKGMYQLQKSAKKVKTRVQLLGSGTILVEAIKAAEILEKEYSIAADIWSVTSFNELRRDIESVRRNNRLHPSKPQTSYVAQCLAKAEGPVIAATDYVKLFADQIRSEISQPYHVLGTNGYGRSDTRKALRDFFEVDAKMIVYTALYALHEEGKFSAQKLTAAAKKLGIGVDRPEPILS